MSRKSRAESEAALASTAGRHPAPPATDRTKHRRRTTETPASADPGTAGLLPASAASAAAPTVAAAPAPAPAAAIAETLGIVSPALALYREIPLARIFASPLNPRKTLPDPAEDARLALSIAQKGLLQPVLARPARQSDLEGEQFELILGSRRLRAARLAQAGIADPATGLLWRLPEDYALPCRIRDCDDDELVILAGVENFDRADMAPLDEAELFAAIRPRVKPIAKEDGSFETRESALGRLFHIAERTVFRRLALTRLAPELTLALREQAITLGQAQAFALGPHNDQRRVWKESRRGEIAYLVTPGRLRQQMTEQRITVDAALFDPALYRGEVVSDPETGEAWFADRGEFLRLQELAVRAKADELQAKWPWVEIHRGTNLWSAYEVNDVKKSDKEAGAVIVFGGHQPRAEIHAPALRRKDYEARRKARAAGNGKGSPGGNSSAAPAPRPPLTEAQIRAVHAAKTRALRRGVAADRQAALALAVLGLLGCVQVRGLQVGDNWDTRGAGAIASDAQERQAIARLVATAALPLPAAQKPPPGELPVFSGATWRDGKDLVQGDPALWFAALYEMAPDDLAELHTRLVAERVGSWAGYAVHSPPWFGDAALAVTVAETVDAAAHLPALWQPDAEFFKSYGKERLFRIVHDQLHRADANRLKKGEIAAACTAQPTGFWHPGLFPELAFQSEAAAKEALDLEKRVLPSPETDDSGQIAAAARGASTSADTATEPPPALAAAAE